MSRTDLPARGVRKRDIACFDRLRKALNSTMAFLLLSCFQWQWLPEDEYPRGPRGSLGVSIRHRTLNQQGPAETPGPTYNTS